jgi:very-short-patch-repair endonuclease
VPEQQKNTFAHDSLESIRNRLLDLTNRNRLLNFRHTTKGNVRIIDELPDQLADLILNSNSVRFIPVPEPTREELIEHGFIELDEQGREVKLKSEPDAREWAKIKGLNLNYELPEHSESDDAKHNDSDIQTLLYPRALEALLRNIRNKANTAIQETGANILYIAFGFLEWFEDKNSSEPRHAPLYLVPVSIEKAELDKELGVYTYTIKYTGDDIVPNLSLREKLKFDFNVGLPDIAEEQLPEDYFKAVENQVIKNKPRWMVKRFSTLSLFDFGKLLMYLDLDPERWPEGPENITNHSIVKKFFDSASDTGNESQGGTFSEEYEIDNVPEVHDQYPIIDNADSSQHSALIDAVKGHNLVIEGPPGSGKSQTITNIIAAAISQGKKVLFVAEKMAALKVVKTRLERANLGDFCLELHSNKTQKKFVYQDIGERIARQKTYRNPQHLEDEILIYEDKKKELNEYAELINSEWKNTGLTIHQIFTAATKYRQHYRDVSITELQPDHISGETFDSVSRKRTVDNLQRYALVFEQVKEQLGPAADISAHPWFGVYNIDIQIFESDAICDLLSAWQTELKKQFDQTCSFNQNFETTISTRCEINSLIEYRSALPSISGMEQIAALTRFNNQLSHELCDYLAKFRALRQAHLQNEEIFSQSILNSEGSGSYLEEQVEFLLTHFKSSSFSIGSLHKIVRSLDRIKDLLTSIFEDLELVKEQIPAIQAHFPSSLLGLQEFKELSNHTVALKSRLISKRSAMYDQDELDEILPDLTATLERIQPLHSELEDRYDLDNLVSSRKLSDAKQIVDSAGFFKWLDSSWRVSRKLLLSQSSSLKPKLSLVRKDIDKLVRYMKLKEQLDSYNQAKDLLKNDFKGVSTQIEDINDLRAWYKAVNSHYGLGFSEKAPIAKSLFEASDEKFKALQHLFLSKTSAALKELEQLLNSCLKELHCPPMAKKSSTIDMEELKAFVDRIEKASEFTQKSISNELSLIDAKESLEIFFETLSKAKSFREDNTLLNLFAINEVPDYTSDDSPLLQKVEATFELYKSIQDIPIPSLRDYLIKNVSVTELEKLENFIDALQRISRSEVNALKTLSTKLSLDEAAWIKNTDGTFKAVIARNEHALNNPAWLSTWIDFIRIRKTLSEQGLENLLRNTEQGKISLSSLEAIYNFSVFDTLSREVITENEALAHFSGSNQNAIRQQFKEYDEKLKLLQREKIAYQVGHRGWNETLRGKATGRVSSFTEMGLISNEVNKKTRHVPLRQVIKRAGTSLQGLKPCFMMGPSSVAQYLEPRAIDFDLIVMDEASQIKPEDALGTIARGKQVVVVGDPKQLPPTSFFDKAVEQENDDATAIEQSESILDVAIPMFDARRLRWHYRSRHESLIAFSNKEFYDNNLIIFPSPANKSDEFGVKFTHIKRGYFVNQRNIEEAQAVAEAVRHHVLNRKSESLGVVAMSSQQRDQIDSSVEALSKEDPRFMEALVENENSDEPLFIKNLENVQGDERDVIFISFTYGPQQSGAATMPQRFGPINQASGGRRLNVLFTRSKKRMHAFSSMTEGHIQVTNTSSLGVRALKRFLGYAQTGIISQAEYTGKTPDSDFEVAVIDALKDYGFDADPQVGVGGYYIDLAVKDPGQPGRYLMGIECDGATYHSAKSARDRDNLRQSVLESLGWRIRRIWSTDWFKNPEAQLRPIVEELSRLKTNAPETSIDSESDEINALVETEEKEHSVTDRLSHSDLSLNEKLKQFGKTVVQKQTPVDASNQLLRPAMIDALCEFRPVTKSEFVEFIPGYLRNGTSSRQGVYLEQVLNIISEAEEEQKN